MRTYPPSSRASQNALFSDFLAYSDTQCCRVVAQPLRLSKIHGRVLTTLFNAIVCFPKGIELSISFVVRGKVTKQPFHHFDKNVFSLSPLQMIRPLVRWLGTLHQKRPITLKGIFLSRVPTEIIERNCDWACRKSTGEMGNTT